MAGFLLSFAINISGVLSTASLDRIYLLTETPSSADFIASFL